MPENLIITTRLISRAKTKKQSKMFAAFRRDSESLRRKKKINSRERRDGTRLIGLVKKKKNKQRPKSHHLSNADHSSLVYHRRKGVCVCTW